MRELLRLVFGVWGLGYRVWGCTGACMGQGGASPNAVLLGCALANPKSQNPSLKSQNAHPHPQGRRWPCSFPTPNPKIPNHKFTTPNPELTTLDP